MNHNHLLVPPILPDMLLSFQFGFELQVVQSAINHSPTEIGFTGVEHYSGFDKINGMWNERRMVKGTENTNLQFFNVVQTSPGKTLPLYILFIFRDYIHCHQHIQSIINPPTNVFLIVLLLRLYFTIGIKYRFHNQ